MFAVNEQMAKQVNTCPEKVTVYMNAEQDMYMNAYMYMNMNMYMYL